MRNGTTTRETEIVSNISATTALKGGYSTRQSNLSASGGGAIYGCRSKTGGSAAKPLPQNPCVRANNLSTGYAFEFNAANGNVGGLFSVGAGGDDKKPFVTNATGVATGLNADRVDGKSATDLTADAVAATRAINPFAQVTAAGAAGETRGLRAPTIAHTANSGNYALEFNGDLSKCAVSATITDATGGEISATPVVAAGNTTVTVRTRDSAGGAADRAFHVLASC